ncbi:MAG: glycosyltransferase family 39 protein, partial [Brevundimonas sp.]
FLLMHRAAVTAVIASIVLGVVAHGALAGTLRQLRPLSVSPQLNKLLYAADLHPRQGRPGPVAIAGYHEPSFVFLTGRDTELTDAEGAARALAEGRPAIVEEREAEAFRAATARTGVPGRQVGEVRGHNYSQGDDVDLFVYAPPTEGPAPAPAQTERFR